MQAPPIEQIQELAQRITQSEGLELVDVEFKIGKARSLLRVFIDKNGGVTLSDCETVSRQLSAILDVKDIISSAYVLEVSSPGIDRPFKTDRDYERSLGKAIKVLYTTNGESQSVTGTLLEMNDQEIVVQQGNEMRRIPRDDVRRVHQEILLPSHPRPHRKKHKHNG